MEFKKQFKEAHPDTIGETDSHFDESNYIDWIDREYAQLKADKAELLEALENLKLYGKWICNNAGDGIIIDFETMDEIESLIQKMK